MNALGGGLIGGLSNSADARTSTGNQTASSTSTPSYSPLQTGLQTTLGTYLQSLMTPGQTSPAVTAQQNQSADQINRTYAGLGDRMNRFLAARGFGKSGKVGQAALQTELGRSSALAGNSAAYGKTNLDLQQNAASLAERMAYANPSTTSNSSGNWSSTAAGSAAAGALAGTMAGLNNPMSSGNLLSQLKNLLNGGSSNGNPATNPFASSGGYGGMQTGGNSDDAGGIQNLLSDYYNQGGVNGLNPTKTSTDSTITYDGLYDPGSYDPGTPFYGDGGDG
jgi:hypothetical protein